MSCFSGTYDQPSNSDGGPGRHRRHCGAAGWKPIEIVAMVLGFIVFWPIGLAILLAKLWQKRSDESGDLPSFLQRKWDEFAEQSFGWTRRGFAGRHQGSRNSWRSSGNLAFDEWREAELARLEEERRKLLAAEREFTEFMENLRRAKDREEFERFMNARRNGGANPQA